MFGIYVSNLPFLVLELQMLFQSVNEWKFRCYFEQSTATILSKTQIYNIIKTKFCRSLKGTVTTVILHTMYGRTAAYHVGTLGRRMFLSSLVFRSFWSSVYAV